MLDPGRMINVALDLRIVRVALAQIGAVTVLTLIALGAGVLLALLYAGVSMRPGAAMRTTALAGFSIS